MWDQFSALGTHLSLTFLHMGTKFSSLAQPIFAASPFAHIPVRSLSQWLIESNLQRRYSSADAMVSSHHDVSWFVIFLHTISIAAKHHIFINIILTLLFWWWSSFLRIHAQSRHFAYFCWWRNMVGIIEFVVSYVGGQVATSSMKSSKCRGVPVCLVF